MEDALLLLTLKGDNTMAGPVIWITIQLNVVCVMKVFGAKGQYWEGTGWRVDY